MELESNAVIATHWSAHDIKCNVFGKSTVSLLYLNHYVRLNRSALSLNEIGTSILFDTLIDEYMVQYSLNDWDRLIKHSSVEPVKAAASATRFLPSRNI